MKCFYIIAFLLLISCRESTVEKSVYENHLNSTAKKLNELGVSLDFQFVIGNANEILEAVKTQNFDYLSKIENENKLADFSLHIGIKDIELLVSCASKIKNNNELVSQNFINFKKPYIDNSEFGAIQSTSEFINLFSSLDESKSEELTQEWFIEMAKIYPKENIEITEDAKEAVRKLIQISKQAKLHNEEMVFVWTT